MATKHGDSGVICGHWEPCPTCKGCKYQMGEGKSTRNCGYLLMTGKRRPCPSEEVWAGRCTVRQARGKYGSQKEKLRAAGVSV